MCCMGSGTTRIDIQRDKLMESEEKHAVFRMRRDVFIKSRTVANRSGWGI